MNKTEIIETTEQKEFRIFKKKRELIFKDFIPLDTDSEEVKQQKQENYLNWIGENTEDYIFKEKK